MRTTRHYLYIILFLSPLVIASCNSNNNSDGIKTPDIFSSGKFDKEDFVTTLSASLSKDTTGGVAKLYHENTYNPLWLGEDGDTKLAIKLLNELDSLKWDGLNPDTYNATNLRKELDAFDKSNSPALADVIKLDTGLTSNYYKASKHLLLGRMLPKKADSLWFHANDSTYNLQYIVSALKGENYPTLDSFRSHIPAYTSLQKVMKHYAILATDSALLAAKAAITDNKTVDSNTLYVIDHEPLNLPNISYDSLSATQNKVSAYQTYYGLKATGKLDSTVISYLKRKPEDAAKMVAANMERLRWLPRNLEKEYVLVNVPQMELTLIRDGQKSMHMNVVVGKPARQTPTIGDKMANIVFNPSWGVPPTILKNDVLPGMQRSGGAYLRRKGLRVFDHNGRPVDAYAVNSSNYKRYVFKQAPGDRNALGDVKFNLPNKWDIYLHDTPHREDFVKSYRALSSGCVRVQQPRELAEYILNEMNGRNFDQYKIDSIVGTRKTRWETLKNKLPVHIVYLTAFDDGTGSGFRFARDIYKRDAKLMAALAE